MRSRAFTLVELMIVIAIIAIVTAFVIPNYRPVLEESRAEEGVQVLQASLRAAREIARAQGEVEFSVNPTTRSGYTVKSIADPNKVYLDKSLPYRVQFQAAYDFHFKADGSTDLTSGTVLTIVLTDNEGSQRQLTVNADTGRVEGVIQ
ncbi:MAG: Tfp pilus assembly protein FimT/FimU [Candidatus Saccharibacteria bacterium]